MSPKFATLLLLALLLCSTLTSAARPEPTKTQLEGAQTEHAEVEESCDGLAEEECLMRRTLVAHTDYIYTQKHGNP